MNLTDTTRIMLDAGIRRLCVISGEAAWAQHQTLDWQQQLTGDWVTVGAKPLSAGPHSQATAVKTLLGREFSHGIFDAREGFNAEAFAALAGTLRAGSWLLLLVPEWQHWATQPDQDSLRWADSPQAIATPQFVTYLQQLILADPEVWIVRQHQPVRVMDTGQSWPRWQCRAPARQQDILAQLLAMPEGVAVITAARGRGKSALAGMLAQRCGSALVTAPAKVSTDVLARFAAPHFHFIAPDALLATEALPEYDWLIIDEAAAIPTPLLRALVLRFPRVLLTTTVQGYEGTGRGFMLKFCAELGNVRHFTLGEPLRWCQNDPLEQWLDRAFLFQDEVPSEPVIQPEMTCLTPADWPRFTPQLSAAYRLLAAAHYRTSPLDLRRMMDAPGMQFWLAGHGQGALWLVEEGGLPADLALAVWAGFRRPRGNLVAQSLAAHAGFTPAATLRSRRISRIAVVASQRRHGLGQALVRAAEQQDSGLDYLSVSFGYTAELAAFWRQCGFTLVRIGSQREASSGCYAAMALKGISAAGKQLTAEAHQQLIHDWPFMATFIDVDPGLPLAETLDFTAQDAQNVAGFAWAQRPFEASVPALARLLAQLSAVFPLLGAAVEQQPLTELTARYQLAGRKALIAELRQQAAQALWVWDREKAADLQAFCLAIDPLKN